MQWIKATDRMPEDWDSVSAIKNTKNGAVISTDFIYKVHTETLSGIELDNSMWRGKGFIEMEDIEWLDESNELSDHAKQKLDYITGHSIATQLPEVEPDKQWAGAVLDLLEELGLIR